MDCKHGKRDGKGACFECAVAAMNVRLACKFYGHSLVYEAVFANGEGVETIRCVVCGRSVTHILGEGGHEQQR